MGAINNFGMGPFGMYGTAGYLDDVGQQARFGWNNWNSTPVTPNQMTVANNAASAVGNNINNNSWYSKLFTDGDVSKGFSQGFRDTLGLGVGLAQLGAGIFDGIFKLNQYNYGKKVSEENRKWNIEQYTNYLKSINNLYDTHNSIAAALGYGGLAGYNSRNAEAMANQQLKSNLYGNTNKKDSNGLASNTALATPTSKDKQGLAS